MKHSPNERGIIPVIVALVVVALVVIAGLAIYNLSKHQQNVPIAKSSSTPSATPSSRASTSPTPSPASMIEFKVTELGFEMTLPAGLTGLNYVAQTNISGSFSDGTPYTLATSRFSTTSLQQSDSQCTAANNAIGTIVRYSEDPMGRVAGVTDVKKLGNYYFGFETPQQPCSSTPGVGQVETSQINLLRQAFENATAL